MEIVVGCLLSFLCGVVCTLTTQLLHVEKKKTDTAPSASDTESGSRHDEKLREQWESFLNYNGKEQIGGDE